MNHKKQPLYVRIGRVLPLFLFLSLSLNPSILSRTQAASYASPIVEQEIQKVTYEVTAYNESTLTMWWDSDPAKIQYWKAEIGSLANLTIESVEEDDIIVQFEIGNLTKGSQTDTTYAGALVIGYWKVNESGFVISTDYESLRSAYESLSLPCFIWNDSITRTYAHHTFTALAFSFCDGFQRSSFEYDRDTGLLISMYTHAGNYELGLKLVAVEGSYFSSLEQSTVVFPWVGVLSVLLLAPIIRRLRLQLS